MGIKDFTKLFKPRKIVTLKDLKGKFIAIDAMALIYSSSLGVSDVESMTYDGKPTAFMSVIWYKIINFIKADIATIWVFDNEKTNVLKKDELKERSEKRKKATEKLIEEKDDEKKKSLKKQTFRIETWMIDEIKFMLECFGIPYLVAPENVEAECFAANMTCVDGVFSPDADAILFGAECLIKCSRGELQLYYLSDILNDHGITREQLIMTGVVLGCDFFKDKKTVFPRIGVKTVLKKIKDGCLDCKFIEDHRVKEAFDHFNVKRDFDYEIIPKPPIGVKKLIEHLSNDWGFNKDRLTNSADALKKVLQSR